MEAYFACGTVLDRACGQEDVLAALSHVCVYTLLVHRWPDIFKP